MPFGSLPSAFIRSASKPYWFWKFGFFVVTCHGSPKDAPAVGFGRVIDEFIRSDVEFDVPHTFSVSWITFFGGVPVVMLPNVP